MMDMALSNTMNEDAEKPLISVVMAAYNEPMPMLKQAVQSVLDQTYSNIELVVVIDDPDREDIYQYLARLQGNIIVHRNEKNMGLPKSLNTGISLSKGRVIARMDADDICLPDRIEVEYRLLSDGKFDIVGGDVNFIGENGALIDCRRRIPKNQVEFDHRIRHFNCMVHPTFMFQRTAFDQLGGYKHLNAAQDYEFIRNAVANRMKIGLCQDKVLLYRMRTSGISHKKAALQFFIMDYIRTCYNSGQSVDENYVIQNQDGVIHDLKQFEQEYTRYTAMGTTVSGRIRKMIYLISSRRLRRWYYHIVLNRIFDIIWR